MTEAETEQSGSLQILFRGDTLLNRAEIRVNLMGRCLLPESI